MRLPRECYQMQQMIETHLTHLSGPQLTGLVLWVCGAILAGSACQNAVASARPGADGTTSASISGSGCTRKRLPDPGREPLLRAVAQVGPCVVAFR